MRARGRLTACAIMLVGALPAVAARPTIMSILADDVAQGDLGCNGQRKIQAPNLDHRMAAKGTRYMQVYSGTSVSVPKREYFCWELHEGKFIQALRFGDWKAVRNGPQAAKTTKGKAQ